MPSFAVPEKLGVQSGHFVSLDHTMSEPSFSVQLSGDRAEERLDSWKEIAAYLGRDVTTVQRWEKREGMPVHRHLHDKRGSVYALASELDVWRKSRKLGPAQEENTPGAEELDQADRSAKPSYWPLVIGAIAIGLLVVAVVVFRGRDKDTAQPRIRSLAVLPLRNLSGDASQDYLADGMTEALIGRLSGIHDLHVISHTSVIRFKNSQLSAPEIAKTLDVDAIVEGSVVRQGNRIRVTVQLIRAATDEHFWSETYDRELQDALTLESELAQAIAQKVEATMSGREEHRLTSARPIAPEVYESYLKGISALEGEHGRSDIEKSIGYFDDAISRDAAFAPAYLGLARAYTTLGTVFVGVPSPETRPKAISAARKALELDPDLAQAHVLLANTLQQEWQWTEAKREYTRALDLAPNNASAHAGFSLWLLCQGRTNEALGQIERGRELDPVGVSGANVSTILFFSHRFDEAVRESRSAVAVHPDDPWSLLDLGFALLGNRQPKDAIPVLEKAASISHGSPAVDGLLIRAYAQDGRREDALRALADLKKRESAGFVPAAAFVNAYLGLGDKEQAFVWLEQAYGEQSNILQFVKTHPFFDPIRDDPRFGNLVRRVGLQ
jgi:TolB-like protein/Tfp pilus assembly protein PilF